MDDESGEFMERAELVCVEIRVQDGRHWHEAVEEKQGVDCNLNPLTHRVAKMVT